MESRLVEEEDEAALPLVAEWFDAEDEALEGGPDAGKGKKAKGSSQNV